MVVVLKPKIVVRMYLQALQVQVKINVNFKSSRDSSLKFTHTVTKTSNYLRFSHPQPFSQHREKGVYVPDRFGRIISLIFLTTSGNSSSTKSFRKRNTRNPRDSSVSVRTRIVNLGFNRVMHFTVQFDHQFGTGAVKIHNVPPKRFLPQKPHSLEISTPQNPPQHFFGWRWILPLRFLKLEHVRRHFHSKIIAPKSIPATRDSNKAPFSPRREGSGMRGE